MQNLFKKLSNINKFKSTTNLFQKKFSTGGDFFSPNQRMIFKNGRLRIFDYGQYGGVKKGYIIITSALGLLALNAVVKLYNYQDRNFFGYIFYGATALFIIPRIRGLPTTFNKIISHIDLCQDGRHVMVGYAKYGFLAQELKVDIQQIAKPQSPEVAMLVQFGFPILLDNDMYYLPRDNENIEKDILPAVLNGKYIDTNEVEEEINL